MRGATLEARRPAARLETNSPGLAYWRSAIVGRDSIDPIAYKRLTTHPDFDRACIEAMQPTINRRHTDPGLVRLLVDAQRTTLGLFVLYLDAREGVTLGGIHNLCRELGLGSPGRATAMLMGLRMMGYIVPDPVQRDRRSRRYIPTAMTREAFSKAFQYRGLAFAQIEPEAMRIAERFDDPAVFKAYLLQLGDGLSDVLKRGGASNGLDHFWSPNAGLGILFLIAISGEPGDVFPPRRPIPVSINGLANQFNVSRAHVRTLLRGAEEKGLLHRDAEASTVTFSEPLRDAIVEFHVVSFLAYAACACAALHAVGETPH